MSCAILKNDVEIAVMGIIRRGCGAAATEWFGITLSEVSAGSIIMTAGTGKSPSPVERAGDLFRLNL
jgi:4-hydroxy-3-methylbut-2-en-1-yl diphosphate synthase IspG/GcpE